MVHEVPHLSRCISSSSGSFEVEVETRMRLRYDPKQIVLRLSHFATSLESAPAIRPKQTNTCKVQVEV